MTADIVDLDLPLLEDLKNLYKNLEKDNNNDHNVIIKVEHANFKADSVILKIRSEYFCNLINGTTNIFNKKITLEISDISPTVFSLCLRYIYTGEFSLPEKDDVIFDLFVAAEKLKLIGMVDYLQNYLIEKKTSWIENNLIKVYQTSLKSISFRDLQYYCDAIIKRKPELIFTSSVFHTLERTILLNLIKREDVFLSEVEIWINLTKWAHEQEPPIDKDPRKWNTFDTLEFVKRITDFVPYIRFFTISSEDYFSCVRPYKDALPQNLVKDLEKYYLVRKGSSPPPALPRIMRSSMYFQSPTKTNTPNVGLQRRGIALAKPPKINRSVSLKPVSTLINIRQIKRISRWIYGNESGDNYTKNFLLLAKGNWDSLTKESFHSLCDNKGPTLILARIDNTNEIIGGYNPNSWTSSNSWIMSTDSFIFSFKSDGSGIDSTIFSKVINPYAAIFDGSSDMDVSFGLDLLLFGGEYKHEHYEKRLMDCDNFKIKDFEVFRVKKSNKDNTNNNFSRLQLSGSLPGSLSGSWIDGNESDDTNSNSSRLPLPFPSPKGPLLGSLPGSLSESLIDGNESGDNNNNFLLFTKGSWDSMTKVNFQQMIHQLKLNHGLLIDGYNIKSSEHAIFMNDGELNVNLYNGQPIIYDNINDSVSSENFFVDKNNFNNILQSSDVCINFPVTEITYRGDLLESFSKCMDNDENLHKKYGQYFARNTLIGGNLFIKNLNSASQTQIDVLKSFLFCAYNSAKHSIKIPVNNLFTLDLLPKIVTLDGEELDTHEKLSKWMNNLYREEEKSISIIAYNNLIPVSQLRNNTVSPVDESQPGFFKEKLNLEEWVGDAVNNNLASWIKDFHLFQGLIFNKDYGMEISKKICITFIKIPEINPSDLSYLKIIKPSTKLENFLISHNIYSPYNLSSFPFIKNNNIKSDAESYEDCTHILVHCERYEILLNKENIKLSQEFEYAIEEALNSMKPLKILQDIFNEYGHLFPQRIILGRSLKNILHTLPNSFASETINIRSESSKSSEPLMTRLDKLNISYFLTPKGRIIEKNVLSEWIQNPNNLMEIIEFDKIVPLYKILKEEQQIKVDGLLQNNYRILMTGITDLRDLDVNDIEYYKRINIEPLLEDEIYEVYGSVISKNNSKLEGIYVNFGSYDFNGFFAVIKKLEETKIDISECNVLWMIVEKPSELLVFSPSNREFHVECIKVSIVLQPNKSNYYITSSFPLTQGNAIFVHAYCPSTNYEPDIIINLVKWSHDYINFRVTKSVYNEPNNSSTYIEEDINLDLHICILCSDYKNLKIDNNGEVEYSLDLTGYVLTKDNFNENLFTEIKEVDITSGS